MNGIDKHEAIELLACPNPEAYALFSRANAVRIAHRGLKVRLCGVINAKSGHCTEDCKFCAQSAHNDSEIECYPLVDSAKMVGAARTSAENQATRFGIVTSGLAIENEREVDAIAKAVETINQDLPLKPCASLGNVSRAVLERLKQAGLTRYHCNLETAESFFPNICTTRDWSDSKDTVKAAKELGLATCSGGLFGLGESLAQRVELFEALRDLDVDSVPLNFLHPRPGTPLESITSMTPLECLKIIAVARLMLPEKEIRVCGGREHNLRDLQSVALLSGADGLMVGGYLTTSGRNISDDIQMIKDAGFEVTT